MSVFTPPADELVATDNLEDGFTPPADELVSSFTPPPDELIQPSTPTPTFGAGDLQKAMRDYGIPNLPENSGFGLTNPDQDRLDQKYEQMYGEPADDLLFKLAPIARTPDQQQQLASLVATKNTPPLPTSSTAGQALDAAFAPPKPFTDLVEIGREIQQNNHDTTMAMRALAARHGINPDSVAPLPSKVEQLLRGTGNAAVDIALPFTSPGALVTGGFGALPKTVQKAAALGFSGQMLSQFPEQAQQLLAEENQSEDQRDYQKITEHLLDLWAGSHLGVAAGAHAFGTVHGPGGLDAPIPVDGQSPIIYYTQPPPETLPSPAAPPVAAELVLPPDSTVNHTVPAPNQVRAQAQSVPESDEEDTLTPPAVSETAPTVPVTPSLAEQIRAAMQGNQLRPAAPAESLNPSLPPAADVPVPLPPEAAPSASDTVSDQADTLPTGFAENPLYEIENPPIPVAEIPVAGGGEIQDRAPEVLFENDAGKSDATVQPVADPAAPGPVALTPSEVATQRALEIIQNAVGLNKVQAAHLADLQQRAINGEGKEMVKPLTGSTVENEIKTAAYDVLKKDDSIAGQAHHLNQNAVYRHIIPRGQGVSIKLNGNAFTDIGSPHYQAHKSLEQFWREFRKTGQRPTNLQYTKGLVDSLRAAGLGEAEVQSAVRAAIRQRIDYGLLGGTPVPRIPGKLGQKTR